MWKVVDSQKNEAADAPSDVSPPAVNIFQDDARWVKDYSYTSPARPSSTESRRTLELILAVYESARTGKTVNLPLAG
jgi:hypothetical protein